MVDLSLENENKFYKWRERFKTIDEYDAYVEEGGDEDEYSGASKEAFDWWINISDRLKGSFVRRYRKIIEEEGFKFAWTVTNGKSEGWDLNDPDFGFNHYLLTDYIVYFDVLALNFQKNKEQYCEDIESLSYLPYFEELMVPKIKGVEFEAETLNKLKSLKRLTFSVIGENDFEKDSDELIKFAKEHPEMEYLCLTLSKWLDSDLINDLTNKRRKKNLRGELKKLMPKCDIEFCVES